MEPGPFEKIGDSRIDTRQYKPLEVTREEQQSLKYTELSNNE